MPFRQRSTSLSLPGSHLEYNFRRLDAKSPQRKSNLSFVYGAGCSCSRAERRVVSICFSEFISNSRIAALIVEQESLFPVEKIEIAKIDNSFGSATIVLENACLIRA